MPGLTPFGIAARKLRLDKQLRLLDVAKLLDCSAAFLSAIETGRKPIPDSFVLTVARAMKLSTEELATLRKLGSRLQGHVDRQKLPGIEASTGCLGQGIGMAVGMALDNRLAGRTSRVFAILGDGECQAGPTWEALMAGGHYRLDQLVVILDRNGYETDGSTEAIMGIDPIAEKFRSFRYETVEIDGHDFPAILGAFAHARATRGRPTAIIARTVKGKGVSFMQHQHSWHGKAPNRDEAQRALAELGASL